MRNDLGLKSTKLGCGLGQCGVCKMLIDGQDVPSCQVPVRLAQGREIAALEGSGTAGHASLTTTQHYLHLVDRMMEEQLEKDAL